MFSVARQSRVCLVVHCIAWGDRPERRRYSPYWSDYGSALVGLVGVVRRAELPRTNADPLGLHHVCVSATDFMSRFLKETDRATTRLFITKAKQNIFYSQFLVLLLFAGYLADVDVPCPLFHNGKLTFKHFRLFGRFPVSVLLTRRDISSAFREMD